MKVDRGQTTVGAAGADIAVLRVVDDSSGLLEARAVAASSTVIAAELQGSRIPPASDSGNGADATAERLGLGVALGLPIAIGERELGRLELLRRTHPFTAAEEAVGRLAAEHAAVALAGYGPNGKAAQPLAGRELLRLGGDALATGLDPRRTAEEIARLAAQGTSAESATVWSLGDDLQPSVAGSFGPPADDPAAVVDALAARKSFSITSGAWIIQLGQPAVGALELHFEQPFVPADEVLDALMTFAARAAHALRSTEQARRQSVELARSRAVVADVTADVRLAPVREQLAETGIEAAIGLPLRVHEDLIGLLAAYPQRGRTLTQDELALVIALAAQLAVVVQNARLHEQGKRRENERLEALEAEKE